MADYTKHLLSGSANGKPIKIDSMSITSGILIHTAISGINGFDEIFLFVSNVDSVDHELTLGWGGVTDPDDLNCKDVIIPANSPPIPIIPGLLLQNALSVYAAADAADLLLICGYVNRIA